jgi:hypothetical protein
MGKQERQEAVGQLNQQNQNIQNNSTALGTTLTGANATNNTNAGANENGASTGFNAAQNTGLWDPTQLDSINKSFGGIASTGGAGTPLSNSSTTNLNQAGQTFGSMASTGGFTPQQSADYMRQATSTAPALFQNLSQNLQQRNIGTGGYSPGGNAALLALQRQAGNQLGTLNTQGEVGLNAAINSNKLAGAGGLAGVGSTQGSLANAIAQLKLQGTQGQAGVQQSLAGNELAGTQGLAGLYGTNQNAINQNLQQQLGLFTGTNTGVNQNLSTIAGLSNQPGTLETILGAIGGGIGGGIGALGNP